MRTRLPEKTGQPVRCAEGRRRLFLLLRQGTSVAA
jgi:hypothetical protein